METFTYFHCQVHLTKVYTRNFTVRELYLNLKKIYSRLSKRNQFYANPWIKRESNPTLNPAHASYPICILFDRKRSLLHCQITRTKIAFFISFYFESPYSLFIHVFRVTTFFFSLNTRKCIKFATKREISVFVRLL